ncbi:MAG: aspartate--ammonia ligase [Thermoguttaceae bacterium]|nr:aspartate--ammonia ligase [Thermoguttaceae bacterium]
MTVPAGYKPLLGLREVERAIKQLKDHFESELSKKLNLQRVTAPLFVRSKTGLNDDLNGIEKPVSFHVRQAECDAELVQSLAKWKRFALKRYDFQPGEGLYTDMNAIRPDETLDCLHSFYVDQWDWCKVIRPEDRKVETLKEAVEQIYSVLYETERFVADNHPGVKPILPEKITFVSTQTLCDEMPDATPLERESAYCEKYGAIFVLGIGGKLKDGSVHDGRAPDYDDWTTPRQDGGLGLNGDILVWNPVLKRAFELSSMGIRVDAETLLRQLEIRGFQERAKLPFHQSLLKGELPQTMGGGIGQSRLCMFMLRCCHVGEVACGLWPEDMINEYAKAGVTLL